MIKNLEEGMYVYSVQRKLVSDEYYIKREVLLELHSLKVGNSKRFSSFNSTNFQSQFDVIYWETPKKAFNAWRIRVIKQTLNELDKLTEDYEIKKNKLESLNNRWSNINFDELEIEKYPDNWEPCDF